MGERRPEEIDFADKAHHRRQAEQGQDAQPPDGREAGKVETGRGTLVVSWFTSTAFEEDERYRQHAATLSAETRQRWLGSWVQRSVDGGGSWSEPTSVSASAPHGPVQLADGRIDGTDGGPDDG